MLQLFCATLTTPAKPCFYRKSLHIHDQLQDIFNKKKNVCNAETSPIKLFLSPAMGNSKSFNILCPIPKQHLSEKVLDSVGFRISPPGSLAIAEKSQWASPGRACILEIFSICVISYPSGFSKRALNRNPVLQDDAAPCPSPGAMGPSLSGTECLKHCD